MATILCTLINIYVLVLIARAVCSFFPVRPGTAFAQVVEVLARVTDPVLLPLRRVIPPIGMFDLSFLVLIIGLRILQAAIC